MSTMIDCRRGVKNGKAQGRDGITNEVLAFFNWESLCRLKCLFEKRLNNESGGEVGELWFDIDIQCLPTKNNKSGRVTTHLLALHHAETLQRGDGQDV